MDRKKGREKGEQKNANWKQCSSATAKRIYRRQPEGVGGQRRKKGLIENLRGGKERKSY